MPVIKHYKGVCHLFVDASADPDLALRLLLDGKTGRPSACNALETLLVHADIAETFFAHNISLRYAKITTLDQRIEDSFITYSPSLQDPQTQNTLKQALIEVLTP